MIDLAPRQAQCLAFICAHIRAHGFPPDLRTICRAMGMGSTNAASDHLRALCRKGYIERVAHTGDGGGVVHSIRVLRTDDGRPILLGVSEHERAYYEQIIDAHLGIMRHALGSG